MQNVPSLRLRLATRNYKAAVIISAKLSDRTAAWRAAPPIENSWVSVSKKHPPKRAGTIAASQYGAGGRNRPPAPPPRGTRF